jgi:4-amino-4-deoxy-L-arabinose transferase-like glycosyltransferase
MVSNTFPPGYPLLMTPLRWLTDSFFAQKVMNGLFMLSAILLLYFAMVRSGQRRELAFIAGAGMILSERTLHFACIMMSEMSFLLCSALVVVALIQMDKSDHKQTLWKDKWFYVLLLALALGYHIRTQGIALVGAVVVYLLLRKEWKTVLGTIGGFILLCLPWMLRNRALGLGQSRYFETIQQSNAFRPEDGTLDIGGIVSRFLDTIGMLISQALPNSMVPNVPYSLIGSFDQPIDPTTPYIRMLTDYSVQPQTLGLWLMGLVSLALIVYGFWQLRRLRWLLLSYLVFTFGIIAIFSSPSGNRYITTLIPFLTMGQFVGIYALLNRLWKLRRNTQLTAWPMVLLLLCCKGPLSYLHVVNSQPLPPAYQNYIQIAQATRVSVPESTVVACRKPQLFHLYSGTRATGYAYSSDDKVVLRELVKSKVDYVVLEQLGYASTGLYLWPAVQKNESLFRVVVQLKEPDTFLLYFDRAAAERLLAAYE